jgi:hypothetical protein
MSVFLSAALSSAPARSLELASSMLSRITSSETYEKYPKAVTIVGTTFSILVLRRIFRGIRQTISSIGEPTVIDDRPTLVFSGAACLFSFYGGVHYYLYNHFDLSNIRTTGVSMGCTPAQVLALKMTPKENFRISLAWAAFIWNRPLKCFFMSAEEWAEVGIKCCKQYGITDERVTEHLGGK